MPPIVVDVINNFRADLLRNEEAATRAAAQAWLRVEQSLQAQVDALAYELANTSTPTFGQLGRSARYRALRVQIEKELDKYAAYTEGRIVDGQREMAIRAVSHAQATVNAITTEAQVVVPFNKLSVSATENMIGLAGDGSPLRAVLNNATSGAGDALGQQLITGTALGKNPLAVARAAMRLGLGQSFTRMQTITRTEMLRVYRQTTLASYANSNVVVAYRRLSARDSRVCPGCLMADGRIYQLNEGFDSHPNCRCVALPVLADVPFPNIPTGQEWFSEQPEATQRNILGRGRFEAWQSGRASLDDMVTTRQSDTWGGAIVPTRVMDL